ncbi:hypothetical protein Q8W40_11205 [Vibrio penaeicida]|uniref:hypothetical protein n=1 Tax=Vibrio penaeicida TaxID=104609 RepID=UPI00273517AA|nr:hypothetical protein [Vibrio penaeicida]MDP2572752.1 hypothetical protein [Vibrio penaeicida]
MPGNFILPNAKSKDLKGLTYLLGAKVDNEIHHCDQNGKLDDFINNETKNRNGLPPHFYLSIRSENINNSYNILNSLHMDGNSTYIKDQTDIAIDGVSAINKLISPEHLVNSRGKKMSKPLDSKVPLARAIEYCRIWKETVEQDGEISISIYSLDGDNIWTENDVTKKLKDITNIHYFKGVPQSTK